MRRSTIERIYEDQIKKFEDYLKEDVEKTLQLALPKPTLNDEIYEIIERVDEEIFGKAQNFENLVQLNFAVYCAASTAIEVARQNGIEILPKSTESLNDLFAISQKQFRENFYKSKIPKNSPPSREELYEFWSGIWGVETNHAPASRFISAEEARMLSKVDMDDCEITMKELRRVLAKRKSWSRPGVDGIQTFWYQHFKNSHRFLVEKINESVKNPENLPKYFTSGFTILTPKSEETQQPSQYRPITHLTNIYKIITGSIREKIYKHFEREGILANEQMGGRPNCFNRSKIMVIDSVVMAQKPLFVAYVDYEKAFDSVPHSWLIRVLKLYKVDEILVKFLAGAMANWETKLYLKLGTKVVQTETIRIKRGIFQGDSLSNLWYWAAINPLSFDLNQSNCGLRVKNQIFSHMLFVDDLKLYNSTVEGLESMLVRVFEFSNSVKMKINLKKTKAFSVDGANELKVLEINSTSMDGCELQFSNNQEIQHSYLGFKRIPLDHRKEIKEKIDNFLKKTEEITSRDDLVAAIKIVAINQIFLPPIIDTFGILNWNEDDLKQLNDRLEQIQFAYRRENFRLINVIDRHRVRISKLKDCFRRERNANLTKTVINLDRNVTPLNLNNALLCKKIKQI